jgi:UDP-glucose 4-epimerase
MVLSEAGHEVVIMDNFCNSRKSVLKRLQKILGKALPCVEADVRDTALVTKTLQDYKIDAVIHFSGLKAVGESIEKPIEYYANNVQGTISLLEAMKSVNLKTLAFSSSATVYGDPQYLPIDENHPTSATNAYGRSKLHIEEMLKDVANSDPGWKIICLRYFNPVGAHPIGQMGEDPQGVPNNLMPFITQVAVGKREFLSIFGNDYPTPDGTGVRDYIHVVDLAQGHLAALNYLQHKQQSITVNLGTGKGVSVKEMADTFAKVNGVPLPYKFVDRRPGDVPEYYADTQLAEQELGWKAKLDVARMCQDSWRWQSPNPNGY